MRFEEFIEEITKRVQEEVGENTRVCVKEVMKNNGLRMQGLAIFPDGQKMSPVIYLNGYYETLEKGGDLETITQTLLDTYNASLPQTEIDLDFFLDYENVKDRIAFRLINRERNRELLKHIPHMEYLDLAICFQYIYDGIGEILIWNNHAEMWGVDCQTLMDQCMKNFPLISPAKFISSCGSILLTTENGRYGAATILCPEVIDQAVKTLGKSFYIIPSSIHEVLLVPDDGDENNGQLFREMIVEVNGDDSLISEDEVLSNHAYYYDMYTKEISIAK